MVAEELEAGLRTRIIAAVQAELDRHAATVVASAEKVRADSIRDRNEIYQAFGEQIESLTRTVEELASRDVDEQTSVADRVEFLERDLRKFDEQAARMVGYFNELRVKIQARAEETAEGVQAEFARQISLFDARVEEVAASSLRQHVETSKLVGDRSERLEERVNLKVSTVDGSIREEVGRRIAEIDAHVGRVSQGLDDTLSVLNDRMTAVEQWVRSLDDRLEAARDEFAAIDGDTLDELKDKVSAAAGEAMLVRIDFEKFQEKTGERVESANARLAAVESQLADATMDVSTAIQLERLEELERAVLEFDPRKFAGHDDREQRTSGGTA